MRSVGEEGDTRRTLELNGNKLFSIVGGKIIMTIYLALSSLISATYKSGPQTHHSLQLRRRDGLHALLDGGQVVAPRRQHVA